MNLQKKIPWSKHDLAFSFLKYLRSHPLNITPNYIGVDLNVISLMISNRTDYYLKVCWNKPVDQV